MKKSKPPNQEIINASLRLRPIDVDGDHVCVFNFSCLDT